MNINADKLEFSLSLNSVTYYVSCFRSNIYEGEIFKQLPHQHFDVEFHYVYDGEETVCNNNNGNMVNITAGQTAFIPKRIYHSAYSELSVDRVCFNLKAEYKPDAVSPKVSDYYRIHSIFEYFKDIQIISDPQVVQLMTIYRNTAMQSKHFVSNQKGLLLMSVAMRLLELLNAAVPSKFKTDDRSNAVRSLDRRWIVEEHISRNYNTDGGISSLARELNLSERQTRSFIQKEFNSNYKKLLTNQRMEIANILMQDHSKTLDDIAAIVGYHSYSGFYLAYGNTFGISPEKRRDELLSELEEKNSEK